MLRRMYVVIGVSALTALALACSRQGAAPSSPTISGVVSSDEVSGSDGSTLKVTAPTLVSPINEVETTGSTVPLLINPSTGTYAGGTLQYDFEVYDAANVKIATAVIADTNWILQGLEFERRYTWRVRATASYLDTDGKTVLAYGPWSVFGAFKTPSNVGYIRGNELYDPLFNGKTIGTIIGPAHFVPGVGIALDSLESYLAYQLQSPLTEGEFSLIATNVRTNTEGDKTKIMAMAEGFDDITTNNRRMTIEKRNDGTIAWRLITHDDQIDTLGAERSFVRFNLTDPFLFTVTFRSNLFNVNIKQGGAEGRVIYNFGKHFKGRPYDADPHVVFIGGPGGRAGPASGSVPNMIVRQLWVSANPRPNLP